MFKKFSNAEISELTEDSVRPHGIQRSYVEIELLSQLPRGVPAGKGALGDI
jgi:hypothetical protein